jgi:hypothetical protein
MDRQTLLAVALALAVGLHGFAGGAMATSSVTVQLSSVADDPSDSQTKTLTYQFTPRSNQTVSLDGRISEDGGNVVFDFAEWSDLDTGQGGTETSWRVTAGHTYRVSYEVTVEADAADDTYAVYSTDSGPASERLEADVVAPRFGTVYTQDVELAFESKTEGTATKNVEIPNEGDGSMRPTNVTFSGVPSGFTVDYDGLPSVVEARTDGTFQLDITADETVSKGTYDFEATVRDNLGNAETVPVSVTVEKPPVAGVEGDETVDVGDVLAGSDETTTFTVTEEAGYTGISGVTAQIDSSSQFGSIDFDGLSYVSTGPDGSDTADVTVSVPESASQHADLDWVVRLQPDDENGVGKQVTFTGRVIYPATLGSLSASNTSMVFDEPQSEVSSHTKRVSVEIPNSGDKEMNVLDVTAQTDSASVTADVVDTPDTVSGTSSKSATVEIRADPDAREGDYQLRVTVETEEAGQKTIRKDVSVTHGVELSVEKNSLDYGDLIVTKNLTESTDVAEILEYEDVTGVSVRKVSGPEKWLTVVERPSGTLTAGESAPFVVALQFDTSAKLYREYTWEFRVSGDGVESQTVTVSATAKPYSFDQIRDPLSEHTGSGDWQAETASGMVEALDALESELRNDGEVSNTDLSTSIAAGRATLLFIESVESARETIESDGNEAAQDEIVRAAASYNLLDSYVSKLDSDELRSSATDSRAAAEETVDALVSEQTDYYRSQLESGNVSMIERAHIKRQLAQLASLRGEQARATRLRKESATAFDAYTETVEEGNGHRQRARQLREGMDESMFTVVAGQPLLLNPAKWDAFDRESATVLSAYDDATASFETAGATEEATRVRTERRQEANALQIARYSLYGSTAAYSLGFLGLLAYLVRNTYAYVRDARAAVSGDFLVEA